MLELFVEAGPQSGQRFALAASTVLGRGQFADLVIADLAVSRRHAQIEPEGAAWLLRDLESANGTRHNGKVLLAPVRLDDGDAVNSARPDCGCACPIAAKRRRPRRRRRQRSSRCRCRKRR
jgi:predicted component of type VI protein secretion system